MLTVAVFIHDTTNFEKVLTTPRVSMRPSAPQGDSNGATSADSSKAAVFVESSAVREEGLAALLSCIFLPSLSAGMRRGEGRKGLGLLQPERRSLHTLNQLAPENVLLVCSFISMENKGEFTAHRPTSCDPSDPAGWCSVQE